LLTPLDVESRVTKPAGTGKPLASIRLTGPVTALAGTTTEILVSVQLLMVAGTGSVADMNRTEPGVAPSPVPEIVTA
jgi:hypothetical protein